MSNPNDLMARLQSMYPSAAGLPGAVPPSLSPPYIPPTSIPGLGLTADQVDAMITQRLAALAPPAAPGPDMSRLHAVIGQMEVVFQRALPADQYAEFQQYVQAGGPGFPAILDSKALDPVVQMLWETIKENIK